jgi:hypothetical protein
VKSANMKINEYFDTEDALFHYTRLSTAIEHILPEKRLKLSSLKDTNDPAEYKYKFLSMKGIGVSPDDERRFQEAMRMINSKYDKCGVLCFCSNKKPTLMLQTGGEIEDKHGRSNGWEKSRMWSQYAEGHAGICLVFSKEKLEENLKNKQPPLKYKTGYVKYYQHRSAQDVCLSKNKLSNGALEDHATNYIKENSYLKLIDYRDEAEYRTIIFNQEVKYLDINSSIKGVITGDKTSLVYDSLIKELCNELEIEFLKVRWDSGNLHLIPYADFL